uniref:Uncharacterized protein n=1 Tax=Meloidogyne hapla TaxID=6305 RepID=A0A1I8BER2_MELHA
MKLTINCGNDNLDSEKLDKIIEENKIGLFDANFEYFLSTIFKRKEKNEVFELTDISKNKLFDKINYEKDKNKNKKEEKSQFSDSNSETSSISEINISSNNSEKNEIKEEIVENKNKQKEKEKIEESLVPIKGKTKSTRYSSIRRDLTNVNKVSKINEKFYKPDINLENIIGKENRNKYVEGINLMKKWKGIEKENIFTEFILPLLEQIDFKKDLEEENKLTEKQKTNLFGWQIYWIICNLISLLNENDIEKIEKVFFKNN